MEHDNISCYWYLEMLVEISEYNLTRWFTHFPKKKEKKKVALKCTDLLIYMLKKDTIYIISDIFIFSRKNKIIFKKLTIVNNELNLILFIDMYFLFLIFEFKRARKNLSKWTKNCTKFSLYITIMNYYIKVGCLVKRPIKAAWKTHARFVEF